MRFDQRTPAQIASGYVPVMGVRAAQIIRMHMKAYTVAMKPEHDRVLLDMVVCGIAHMRFGPNEANRVIKAMEDVPAPYLP